MLAQVQSGHDSCSQVNDRDDRRQTSVTAVVAQFYDMMSCGSLTNFRGFCDMLFLDQLTVSFRLHRW